MTMLNPVDLSGYPEHLRWMRDIDGPEYPRAVSQSDIVDRIYRWIPKTLLPGIKADYDQVIAALVAQTDDNAAKIAAALQALAEGSIQITDPAILAVLEATEQSATLTWLLDHFATKNAFGYYTLEGEGIDATGATPSTAAVNAFFAMLPAGASVRVPTGALINLDGTINLTKKVHLWGGGDHELRWTAGIAHDPMIAVKADWSNFDGLYLTNPTHIAANEGNRTAGIYIVASHIRVRDCTIIGQQGAIFADANGEWFDHIIMGNNVLDVPGSGGGPANASDPHGEDRGDGIYSMGATGVIVGNRVTALEGTDARIGIGVENLAVYENISYPYGDSTFTISNNIVTGPFRRSIASEGVADVAITSNECVGWTFWGINIVNTSHRNVVADNTVRATRNAATDLPQWITRAGIYVYDNVGSVNIHDNQIYVNPDARIEVGVGAQVGAGGPTTDAYIHDNIMEGNGRMGLGVQFSNGCERPRIVNNTIRGFTDTAIGVIGHEPHIMGNHIVGPGGQVVTHGISTNGGGNGTGGTHARISDNTIRLVSIAIAAFFHGGWIKIDGNLIESVTEGINTYGADPATVGSVSMNTFMTTQTHIVPNTVPAGFTQIGNN